MGCFARFIYTRKQITMANYDINKENVRNYRDIKLVTTDRRRRSYFVPEPNFHTIKCFSENLVKIQINKTKVIINNQVSLGLSISGTRRKIAIHGYWYNYAKRKYEDNA